MSRVVLNLESLDKYQQKKRPVHHIILVNERRITKLLNLYHSNAPNVITLDLSATLVGSMLGLDAYSSLTHLNLTRSQVTSEDLTHSFSVREIPLKSLQLTGCAHVNSIEFLSQLTSLHTLSISMTKLNPSTGLKPILSLSNLHTFDAAYTDLEVQRDWNVLAKMRSLRDLDVSGTTLDSMKISSLNLQVFNGVRIRMPIEYDYVECTDDDDDDDSERCDYCKREKGVLQCPKCHVFLYCDRVCMTLDYEHGNHASVCKELVDTYGEKLLFKLFAAPDSVLCEDCTDCTDWIGLDALFEETHEFNDETNDEVINEVIAQYVGAVEAETSPTPTEPTLAERKEQSTEIPSVYKTEFERAGFRQINWRQTGKKPASEDAKKNFVKKIKEIIKRNAKKKGTQKAKKKVKKLTLKRGFRTVLRGGGALARTALAALLEALGVGLPVDTVSELGYAATVALIVMKNIVEFVARGGILMKMVWDICDNLTSAEFSDGTVEAGPRKIAKRMEGLMYKLAKQKKEVHQKFCADIYALVDWIISITASIIGAFVPSDLGITSLLIEGIGILATIGVINKPFTIFAEIFYMIPDEPVKLGKVSSGVVSPRDILTNETVRFKDGKQYPAMERLIQTTLIAIARWVKEHSVFIPGDKKIAEKIMYYASKSERHTMLLQKLLALMFGSMYALEACG